MKSYQGKTFGGVGSLPPPDQEGLTICKLHKHVICEINNECIIKEKAWLTVYKRVKVYRAKMGLSITTFSFADD